MCGTYAKEGRKCTTLRNPDLMDREVFSTSSKLLKVAQLRLGCTTEQLEESHIGNETCDKCLHFLAWNTCEEVSNVRAKIESCARFDGLIRSAESLFAPPIAYAAETCGRCENFAHLLSTLENVENCSLNDPILYCRYNNRSGFLPWPRLEYTELRIECEAPFPQI
jgi:hypothetical protein